MCGRFVLDANAKTLQTKFQIDTIIAEPKPCFNIAPMQSVAVIFNVDGERQLDMFRWGLIPSWSKEYKIANRMFNARAETIHKKLSFNRSFKERRCLIPATGFYEWTKTPIGKIPVYIYLKSKQPLAFAGVWDTWISRRGKVINSCSIVTTTSNKLLEPIHNRMPVILPHESIEFWLDTDEKSPEDLLPLLKPYPTEEMAYYAVSKMINSPSNDMPECILPRS